MPSSVLFPSYHIICHQAVDSETREHHSCGMAWLCVHSCTCVRPGARLSFLLGPGSLIKPKGLGWTESTCLSAILKCYLNANSQTYTHILSTYCTNKPQAKKQAFGLSEFPTPLSSSRTTHCLPIKSSQIPFLDFQDLTTTYLTAVLILSPTHLHLSPRCSSLSPNAPTTLPPAFIHAVSELPSLSIIDLACPCGGRLVGSIPDSPSWPHACVMSPGLWCFRGQVHVCSLNVPTGPSFPILSTFRSFVLFCHWKGSRGEGTSLISHSRVRTHLR